MDYFPRRMNIQVWQEDGVCVCVCQNRVHNEGKGQRSPSAPLRLLDVFLIRSLFQRKRRRKRRRDFFVGFVVAPWDSLTKKNKRRKICPDVSMKSFSASSSRLRTLERRAGAGQEQEVEEEVLPPPPPPLRRRVKC